MGMKIFAFFLLIPMSTFAAGTCDELGKYYADFEKRLARKTVISKTLPDCEKFKLGVDDLLAGVAADESVYFDENETKNSQTLIEQVQCKDLSFIENRMRDVESQLNTLNGFKKLVDTIEKSQDDIILDKAKDKTALEGFIADVGEAALLETFVSNPAFFKFLADIDLTNSKTYKDGVEKNCVADAIKKLRKEELCSSLTSEEISESAMLSLRELKAEYTKATDDTKKESLLNRWKAELAITKAKVAKPKKDGEEASDETKDAEVFSFADLNQEIQSKPINTVAEMQKAIKSTTKIEHTKGIDGETIDKLFKKLMTFQTKQDANQEAKRLLSVHNDLFERQKAERESRLSLLWLEFKNGSTETDFDKRVTILKNIQADKAKTAPSEGTHLAEALRALDATSRQMNKLELVTKCLDVDLIKKSEFSKVCENTIKRDGMDEEVTKLTSELAVLKAVHTEIVSPEKNPANAKLVKMKNLAMDALERNKCIDTKFDSNISDCNIEGVLNPEMKNILITGLDVSLMFIAPSTEDLDEAKLICEGTDKSEYNAFCALALKVESKSKKPDRSAESYNGPMDPESRNNPFNQAMYDGARNVASMLGQMIQQNKSPYYMTNGPSRYGAASPTISQYLIGTSVASGQLRSYSSVTQNNFAYKPLR
jgi:hypothetical protein